MATKPEEEVEALRLKTLAEEKYKLSNLKSALKYAKRAQRRAPSLDKISEMVTAFRILKVASKRSSSQNPNIDRDWYKILDVEPFSHINTIKKQYKKLALTLHPDKNPLEASEEAFKLVAEAFRVLSDKIRRKEYDMKLRIALQSEKEKTAREEEEEEDGVGTFWTACSTCRLLHQFERKYVGHNLICPSCKKSFLAVEADGGKDDGDDDCEGEHRVSDKASRTKSVKMSSVGEVLERSRTRNESFEVESSVQNNRILRDRSKIGDWKTRNREIGWNSEPKMAKIVKEKTLAEMQLEVMQKMQKEKLKARGKVVNAGPAKVVDKKEKGRNAKEKGSDVEKEKQNEKKRSSGLKIEGTEIMAKEGENKEKKRRRVLKSEGMEIMAVEDSDFYDFDRDRTERSFKRGQVWAVYDDDDGMPRHYALIDEVVSAYPFKLKMKWLDLQNNGDEGLICCERLGIHISCGRFRVAKETIVDSVNVFSHCVECERAARELYRIYPKKGSVWALYYEGPLAVEGRNSSVKDSRRYDIVVALTSYSDIHGLSMAYLEKVVGYKTVFKRREVGYNAIRWIEKDDVRFFSHQIPARKLSEAEAPIKSKDCWELDPASLPPELLTLSKLKSFGEDLCGATRRKEPGMVSCAMVKLTVTSCLCREVWN
ncbi:DnaJ domain [Dillenia turbinata]|uniref:DnaJ domain n=1 Tax=Dillenia turbinata TaxID=194707 RepID=A0AAN8WG60_9MAGN